MPIMKILVLAGGLGVMRGTERMIRSVAAILRKDHEVVVYATELGGDTERILRDEGFRVLVGGAALDEALAFHPDIVNIHHPGWWNPKQAEILRRFRRDGAKVVETNIFGQVDYEAGDTLDLSIQISRWDLYRWKCVKRPLKTLGVYCPNIVETDGFRRAGGAEIAEWRRALSLPADAFVLGRAGKFDWTAMASALEGFLARDLRHWLVSIDDGCGSSAMPKSLKAHPRVRVVPRMSSSEELSCFYSGCDALLNASPFGESFGMIVAESVACGTPVIALSTPNLDNAQLEVMEPGVGGVAIASPEYLGAAVEHIRRDFPRTAERLVRMRESIVSRYSPSVVSRQLRAIFAALHDCDDRSELKSRLESEGFDTSVPHREIRASIANVIGRYPLRVRIDCLRNFSSLLKRFRQRFIGFR